jgi:hypothetical protein
MRAIAGIPISCQRNMRQLAIAGQAVDDRQLCAGKPCAGTGNRRWVLALLKLTTA